MNEADTILRFWVDAERRVEEVRQDGSLTTLAAKVGLQSIKLAARIWADAQKAPQPRTAEPAPLAAISRVLAEVMERAVANGANSVSMPDEYVAIAAWLSKQSYECDGSERCTYPHCPCEPT
jgi:hypothetical protein